MNTMADDDAVVELYDIAKRLQQARVPELFAAKEVLAWASPKGLHLGLRGQALKLELMMTSERYGAIGNLPNRHGELDAALQRGVGLDVLLVRERWGTDVRGGIGQTLEMPDVHFSQALDTLAAAASEVLGADVHATLLPNEGSPWYPGGDDVEYYNARTNRIAVTHPPEWLTKTRVRGEDIGLPTADPVIVDAANVCALARVLTETHGPPIGHFKDGTEFVVSHSFDPAPYMGLDPRPWVELAGGRMSPTKAARLVSDCGGWIYPSLAVGKLASTTFGPVTMVAGSDLVLRGVRRQRGPWLLSLYDTDTWTTNTRDVLGLGAHVLYEQLTGQAEYSVYTYAAINHQWILGPPVRTGGPAGPTAEVLRTDEQLRRALKRRYRLWREDLSPSQVTELVEQATEGVYAQQAHRYPYLEAKLNALMEPGAWLIALVAESWEEDAAEFLDAVGYAGDLVVVTDPPDTNYEVGWDLAHRPEAAYEQSLSILRALREL